MKSLTMKTIDLPNGLHEPWCEVSRLFLPNFSQLQPRYLCYLGNNFSEPI